MSGSGQFIWYDLMTIDPEKTLNFFIGVFGYDVCDVEGSEEGYLALKLADSDDVLCGCAAIEPGEGVRSHWVGYLSVQGVDDACKKTEEAGGEIHMRPELFDEEGEPLAGPTPFAIATDPQGAVFAPYEMGMMQGAPPALGSMWKIGWFELTALDRAAAASFYADLVGWDAGEEIDLGEDGKANPLTRDGQVFGLVRDILPGSPVGPQWSFFIRVDDLDSAIMRAREHGGHVFDGPSEAPCGRRALLVDPSGLGVAIYQSAE